MFVPSKALCATLTLCFSLTASTALAQNTQTAPVVKAGLVEDESGSERINYSGKLRMLSQRIPAAACYSAAGIEPLKTAKMLSAATAEFNLIINGLEMGEPQLSIRGAETDRRVLMGISAVQDVWVPLFGTIDGAPTGGADAPLVEEIALASHPLLKHAKQLVNYISAEYADPAALLQADAITIDLAGRQRMLAQRMSKTICLLQAGIDTERSTKHLSSAKSIYDATLRALRFGAPQVGLKATENAEILAGLDDILTLWETLQPQVNAVELGVPLDAQEMAAIYNGMNSLTGQMNVLVGKYAEISKLGL